MANETKTEFIKKIYRFIGKDSIKLLVIGVFTGTFLFAIEVTFAYLLQAFLVIMKVVPTRDTMNFPSWLPIDNPYLFLCFVISVLFCRGAARWTHAFLASNAYEVQRRYQRFRLLEWVFSSRSVNTGDVITMYSHTAEQVANTLVSLQSMAITLSTSALLIAYLLKISWFITTINFLILGTLALLIKRLDYTISRLGKLATHELNHVHRSLISSIKNLLLLQIYGTKKKEKDAIEFQLNSAHEHVVQYQKILHLKGTIPQTLGVVLICSLCVISTQKSWIPSALMITYFYLFLQFVQNFSEVLRLTSVIYYSMPATREFAKWWADHSLDGVRNRSSSDLHLNYQPLDQSYGWLLKDVTFQYEKNSKPTLKNFSMRIAPNSCTVLVGESGKGKSTILNLALGLYSPNSGEINLIDTNEVETHLGSLQPRLLKSVGYVGPESFFIEGTLKENLLYGIEMNPTETEIREVLTLCECQFIDELPDGLNHFLTEQGQGLSAGQKQRLNFARALLRKPSFLILDEATSNLDSDTEEKMVNSIKKLKGSVTILAVTHRDAILSIADQVIKL